MILPSGEQFELRAGRHRVVVVEVGGGIREWDGVLLGYAVAEMCSSGRGRVLAPWPNRLAGGRYEWDGTELQLPVNDAASGSAIHGLVRWASWLAVEPMTCPPQTFRTGEGVIRLGPGDRWSGEWGIEAA